MKQPLLLNEWIPIECELGKGYAFMIETENHDNWYTIILESQAIVTLQQERILVQKSYTHKRGLTSADMQAAIQHFRELRNGTNTRGQGQGDGQEGPRLVKT